MKYDWKKIIDNQQCSGLTINNYCKERGISISSFYKNKKQLLDTSSNSPLFLPVEVVESVSASISLIIDGHTVQFDASLLSDVIGALK